MATDSGQPVNERCAALVVYQFGEAIVRFRYYAELNYIGASDLLDSGDDRPPPLPGIVDTFLGVIDEHAALLTSGMSATDNVLIRANALATSAQVMRDRLEAVWMDADHRARLRRYQDESDQDDGRHEDLIRNQILQGFGCDDLVSFESPLASSAWGEYQTAADALGESFSPLCRSLFNLSRLLSAVVYPRPSDYDDDRECLRAFDRVHVQGRVSPEVTRLMRVIHSESDLLDGLPERLTGTIPDEAAGQLHENALSCLRRSGRRATIAPNNQVNNDAITPVPSSPPAIPAEVTLSISPLGPDEDVQSLLTLKSEMDREDTYIGQSLPVLRLFHQVEILNRLPDDPIVILGPSGSGKTSLAKIIHDTSERRMGPYRDLSADDVMGGDETIRRMKWAGHGPNSGLPGILAKATAPGLLEQMRGGTIFLDELHNFDEVSLNLLRKVLDRGRQIPLALGTGDGKTPDVRLIFATFRSMEDLQHEQRLPQDFVRRLRGRYLTVAQLKDRKEDIPLFVEKFRGECKPSDDFMLSLLFHDWEKGQVDELIATIKSVVANTRGKGELVVAHLRGILPDSVIKRVIDMPPTEVRRALYSFLIGVLEAQGLKRGRGLQKRLAGLLSFSESKITRRLEETGLNEPNRAGSDPGA